MADYLPLGGQRLPGATKGRNISREILYRLFVVAPWRGLRVELLLLLLLLLLRCGALASVLLVAQTRPGRLTPATEQVLAILSSGRDRRHRLRRGGLRAAA